MAPAKPVAAGADADPALQGMRVQAGLLPYAILAFAIGMPVLVWVGGHAANAAWMSASFALFAVAWGLFYAVVNWMKTEAAADPRRRAFVQLTCGLVWALVIAELALFAHFSGPVRETLLLLVLAAAMICVVFTTPWLPSLLVVAPGALAGPLVALFLGPQDSGLAQLALAASALGLALALLVNRILRNQFALAAERELLIAQRAEQAEAARRLARSKSDLVSTLSDEIRNGLTAVAHVLGSAAGRGRAAPSRQQVGAALEAVNELLAVLETTVDAESAEAGRLSVQPRPIDLTALARDVMDQHRPAAAAKGLETAVHIDVDLAQAPGAVIADPVRTRQILGALVGNAVKFTARGRVEIRLSRSAGGRVAISVADTGPGLSDEELTQALEPFQRVARTAAGSPGAGLGLPLARQLARLMGGQLKAESAPGVGSCFALELPFDPAAALPTTESVRPAAPSPDRRLRILTVEPDALAAAMLRASLEQLGHQVVHAADGRRAVELARICELDLVAASGPETIAALRALDGAAGRTPVVALIGGEPEDAEAASAAGADALLRRPVSVPAAARAIAEALSPRAAPANDRAA
ncbi:MAG: hybrid sensor histidine kinase/response regulator [Pseudomonadota bacterium]